VRQCGREAFRHSESATHPFVRGTQMPESSRHAALAGQSPSARQATHAWSAGRHRCPDALPAHWASEVHPAGAARHECEARSHVRVPSVEQWASAVHATHWPLAASQWDVAGVEAHPASEEHPGVAVLH